MITLDVTSFFAAGAGGIRTYYEAKARWLPARGVECHFAVPGEHASTERFGDGWLHRVRGPALDPSYRCFGDVPALWKLIKEIGPDVVELGSHYVLPQLIAPALRGRAVVGFYHADFPSTYVAPAVAAAPRAARRIAERAAWWLVRAQHRGYAATLAGSHRIADTLESRGVPRVRWVGLGVDVDAFRPSAERTRDTRRLGYLGRLSPDKELGVLLAAAPAITRATGARIVIAGQGPLDAAVKAAAARGEVEAVGLLAGQHEVAAFLGTLDAVIMPGRHESFGLAAVEALATATPVISANRGGGRELVERSSAGLTFVAGDADDLADAVTHFYRLSAPARAQLGARGRAFVEREHTWQGVMARVHGVYAEAARC